MLLAPVLVVAASLTAPPAGANQPQGDLSGQPSEISAFFSSPELTSACWTPSSAPAPEATYRCQNERNTFLPLSPLDEARTLIVGYHPDSEDFIEDLARALLEEKAVHEMKLLILAPAGELARTRRTLNARPASRQLLTQGRLDLRSAANPNNTWLQDAMEIGWSPLNGRPIVYDLPHFESDRAAQSLATTCGLERMDPAATWGNLSRDRAQNHGGNWEAIPGGLLMTLRGANPGLTEDITRHSPDINRVELRAEWLEVGHVDELFSVIPVPSGGRAQHCAFALTAASPARALELARQGDAATPLEPPLSHASPKEHPLSKERLGCIADLNSSVKGSPLTSKAALRCKALREANQEFEKLIQDELDHLLRKISHATGCESIPVIRLPVLFKPSHRMSQETFKLAQRLKYPPRTPWSGARAINPNPVNAISLNSLLLIPEQSHPGFGSAIRDEIGNAAPGVITRYIPTPHVHFLGGEAHCGTNVIRSCTSPL